MVQVSLRVFRWVGCALEADERLAEVEVLVGLQVDDLDGHQCAVHVDLVHLGKAAAAHLPDQRRLDVLPLDLYGVAPMSQS